MIIAIVITLIILQVAEQLTLNTTLNKVVNKAHLRPREANHDLAQHDRHYEWSNLPLSF